MIDATPEQLGIVTTILEKFVPDAQVWVFGSRCTGCAKKHSDLDLVIIDGQPIDYRVIAMLKEDFQESELPFRVDVVDWSVLSEKFRQVIQGHYEILHKTA